MNKLFFIIGLISAITFISSPAPADTKKDNECYEYQPAVVTLTGIIEEKVFQGIVDWGPPSLRDKLYTYRVLKLNQPICVNASPVDIFDFQEKNVHVIQVYSFHIPDFYEKLKSYFAKKVVITGELSHRTTGHQREKVLINVMEINSIESDQ